MTARVDDFHSLESRLRLTGILRARTALRIGAGSGGLDGVDLPVIKDAERDRAKIAAWRLYAVFLARAFTYAKLKKGNGHDRAR